jgi:6-phosphofructokinase 1
MRPKSVASEKKTHFTRIGEREASLYKENFAKLKVDGVIAVGGYETLSTALCLKNIGIPIIAIPNGPNIDIEGTDYVVGFDSYVENWKNNVSEYVKVLKTNKSVGVLEVPNHSSGHAAAAIGLATNACYIGIPEISIQIDDLIKNAANSYKKKGYALVIINQTFQCSSQNISPELCRKTQYATGSAGKIISDLIKTATKISSEHPRFDFFNHSRETSKDGLLGLRQGIKAAEMVLNEQWWGLMTAIRGNKILSVPLDNFQGSRTLDENNYLYSLVTDRNLGKI